jgi:hypothetical protein
VVRLTQDIPPELVKLGPQVVGFFQSILDNLGGSSESGGDGVSQADFDALEVRVDDLEDDVGTGSFTSSDLTITEGTTLAAIPHGLGAAPTKVWAYLVCQTAEHGYSIGHVLAIPCGAFTYTEGGASVTTHPSGIALVIDATNLTVTYANSGGGGATAFQILSLSTFLTVFATNASWKLRLVAAP